MIPGEYVLSDEPITINANRPTKEITVVNHGDRPVQVGSHYHFAEVNTALEFDRQAALGCRLDIPAGTAVRFEPGDEKTVRLIPVGGKRRVYGFHNVVNGHLDPTEPAPVDRLNTQSYDFATQGAQQLDPFAVDKEA